LSPRPLLTMQESKVMQSARGFHHIIDIVSHPVAKFLHHNLAPLDAAQMVFNFNANL
jgi:hypothetical protein